MIAAFKPQPKSRPWLAIVLLLVAGLVTLTDAQNVRPQTIVDRMPQNIFKSLLLYYSFDKDGGNKAVDISGMDNHGRVLGAIYDNGGNGGFRHGGMMFDGKGDTIEIDDIRLKAFTFAVWLNPNIQDVNHRIVFQLKTEECGISIQGNSSHSLGVSIGSGREINDHSYSMHDGPWHYYVVTFNGETVTLYVNGQIAAHGPANMDKTLQGKAILGGSSPSQGEDESCWSGGMDEVALFNQALTYQQVQRLYGLYEGRQETPMAETNIVVSDLTVQPYPAGGLWQAVAKIHNDSDTAVGSFQILFYVNDPQKKQPREYGGGPIVAHGEFNEATLPFSLREDTINTIEVEIDAENNIQETNEDDNHLAIKVMVKDGQVVQLENIHP